MVTTLLSSPDRVLHRWERVESVFCLSLDLASTSNWCWGLTHSTFVSIKVRKVVVVILIFRDRRLCHKVFDTLDPPLDASLDPVIGGLLPLQPLLHPLVLLLHQVVQRGGPLSNTADVQRELVVDLGRRADRERVPLVRGDRGDLDENPVASAEVEASRSLDDQVGDLGGEDDAGHDLGVPCTDAHLEQPDGHLDEPDEARHDDPDPVGWRVQDEKWEEGPVEQVGEVEHVEVAGAPDEGEGADEDGCQNCQEG